MKKMESELRNLKKYKFKITANLNSFTHTAVEELKRLGLSLENIITSTVMEFYRETTKIIVSVDYSSLIKIRQEALSTQEKLSVEQVENIPFPTIEGEFVSVSEKVVVPAGEDALSTVPDDIDVADNKDAGITVIEGRYATDVKDSVSIADVVHTSIEKDIVLPGTEDIDIAVAAVEGTHMSITDDVPDRIAEVSAESKPDLPFDPWGSFRNSLDETEKQALIKLLSGKQDIKHFSDKNGIMLEVLIEGINEKAFDFIGDNILDEDFNVYDDYMEKVQKMVDDYE